MVPTSLSPNCGNERRDSEGSNLRKSPSEIPGNKMQQPLSEMQLRNRQGAPLTGTSNDDVMPTTVGDFPNDSNILQGSLGGSQIPTSDIESAKRQIAFVNENEDGKGNVHPPRAESTPYRYPSHSVLDTSDQKADANVSLTRRPLWTSTVATASESEDEEGEEGTDSASGGDPKSGPPKWMSMSAGEMLAVLIVSFVAVLLVFLQLTASKE